MNKVYGTCKFSVTNNNNLLFLLTFSKKKIPSVFVVILGQNVTAKPLHK